MKTMILSLLLVILAGCASEPPVPQTEVTASADARVTWMFGPSETQKKRWNRYHPQDKE